MTVGETSAAASLCFFAGTPVLTTEGYKAIEDIKVGDMVISRDEARKMTVAKPVVELFRNHDKTILDVTLADANGHTDTLGATPEHPFFVVGRGWIKAGDLTPGDQVESHETGEGLEGALLVKAVNERPDKADTYNFEVADTHTYFVGKLSAWVHNACAASDLVKEGGAYLDDLTIVGAYGNKFVKQADGSFLKVGAATDTEIAKAGVTVRPWYEKANAAADSKVLKNANFAQKTYGSTFSEEGRFAGRSVSDVAADIKAGRLLPSDLPIEYIIREGNTLILNTRSAQALEQAGIQRVQWVPVNMTGNLDAEARLSGQLIRNKLTSQGTPIVRQSNGN